MIIRLVLGCLILIGLTISSTSELCIEQCGRFNLSSVWDPCCSEHGSHSQDNDLEGHHHCNRCSDISPGDTFIRPKSPGRQSVLSLSHIPVFSGALAVSVKNITDNQASYLPSNINNIIIPDIGSSPVIMLN